MLTRKTQYAWMALGGLICLFGLVLACKLRDGNRAIAQPEPLPPPTLPIKDKPAAPPPVASEPSPSLLPPILQMSDQKKTLPPPKSETTKEPAQKKSTSGPKATLEMPLPSDPPPLPAIDGPKPPAPSTASPILPASFGLNEPPPPMDKRMAEPPLPPTTKPATPLPPQSSIPDAPKQNASIPSWNAPSPAVVPASTPPPIDHDSVKSVPGEPPLAPAPGPVQLYHAHGKETLYEIARRTLGSSERWSDLQKLNPMLKPDEPLSSGTSVRLPADACVQADDAEPVKALPALRAKPPAPKAKVLPLTGTYQCSLDEKAQLTLPRAIRDQLNGSDTILLSPGPDKCLWLTNQPHLERLGERLDQSQANEADVRVFKRLYFAQTEKLPVNSDGRVSIPERLGQFAGLHQEVVLVGIDDHFEVWDAARWRSYTQQRTTGRYTTTSEQE